MKPLRAVITNVYVRIGDYLRSFVGAFVKTIENRTVVVSPHILRLLIAVCTVTATYAFGTAEIIIVTGHYVILAADSAIRHTQGAVTTRVTSLCKIHGVGKVAYLAAGEYNNPFLKLYSTVDQLLEKAQTSKTIYKVIEPPILDKLPAIVADGKKYDTQEYRRWIKGTPIMSLVFALIEGGKPVAVVIEFSINSDGKLLPPHERTIAGVFGNIQMVGLGYNSESMRLTDGDSWIPRFRSNPGDFTAGLIQAEIDASIRENRFDVGPPISVLVMSIDDGFSGFPPGLDGLCGQAIKPISKTEDKKPSGPRKNPVHP